MQVEPLSQKALKAIERYDFVYHRRDGGRNHTRFYKWLVRNRNDVQVHTVAVKTRKDKSVCVKQVVCGSVDSPEMLCIDIASVPMNGYVIDWHREGLGNPQYWDYRGEWGSYPFTYRAAFRMQHVPVVNVALLNSIKRFKYSAYTHDLGDILSYLKTYAKYPKVELLVKAGLHHFATKPSFVKQLESNKAFMRFVAQNMKQIEECSYGVDVIRKAFSRKISLSEADIIINQIRYFVRAGITLPDGIDNVKAYEYVHANKIEAYSYDRYLNECQKLAMNFADTKVAFPKQFKRRAKIIHEIILERQRLEKIELQQKMDEDLKAVAQKLSKLEHVRGAFKVVIPRCENDFRREGSKLHHCIGQGGYASGHAKGEYIIAFIRKPGAVKVPFVTLQFSAYTGKVVQCYGRSNSKPEKIVMQFVKGPFAKAAKRLVKAV